MSETFIFGQSYAEDIAIGFGSAPVTIADGTVSTLNKFGIHKLLGPAYVSAADFTGTEAGVQISAAVQALPSTGGVVDCRGLVGNYAFTTTALIDRPVVLIVGATTFMISASPAFNAQAALNVICDGRGVSVFRQTTSTATVFSVATTGSFQIRDAIFNSTGNQSSGAAIALTGNGVPITGTNQQSVIAHNVFESQYVAIESGQVSGMRILNNQFQNSRFRGVRLNNTGSGDEGNNLIHGNGFSSDVALTGNYAIELIAGGGLKVTANQFQTWDIALAVNWNTSGNSSQVTFIDNFCEAQKTAIVKFNRTAGTLGGIIIANNFMTSDPVHGYNGTHIWFATAAAQWTSDLKIIGNLLNLGSSSIGILLEGNGNGDQAMIDGNQMFSLGGSTVGIRIGAGYGQVFLGINALTVNTPLDITPGSLRGIYLNDNVGIGIPQGLVLTEQLMLPKNTYLGARDSTGALQNKVIGTDAHDIVQIADNANIITKIRGPLWISSEGAVTAAQINYVQIFNPTLISSAVGPFQVAEQTYSVPGLSSDDTIIINTPPGSAGAVGIAGVRAGTDILNVTWVNPSASPQTPATGVYRVVAMRIYAT
jgi:hypothetical protein